jgi:hypothetical protein
MFFLFLRYGWKKYQSQHFPLLLTDVFSLIIVSQSWRAEPLYPAPFNKRRLAFASPFFCGYGNRPTLRKNNPAEFSVSGQQK